MSRAERTALLAALLLAAVACGYLGGIVHRTRWTMDADEAVHAVEALRLHDHASSGRFVAFLHDTWFPERWQPPVDPHVRWYPFVHAWTVLPFFAVLGPSDFSARLPSIVLLFGTCIVFFELARRLAVRHRAASGLLAVALLLSAPNVLTFSAQSLIEPSALFFSFLALLAYLWSLERDHAPKRAWLAGLALAVAVLTKYDHGGVLLLSLGLAEVIRLRRDLRRLIASGPGLVLGLPALVLILWFAHPDKLDALGDSMGHPFYGSPRLILIDLFATWIAEYGSSLAMGALSLLAFLLAARRLREPAHRAVWIWALVSTVLLALRARFHFRYNFVEAPIYLLLLAVLLPGWVDAWAARRSRPDPRRRVAWGSFAILAGAAGLGVGAWLAVSPDAFFERLGGPLAWLHDLREDHWGLQLAPSEYIAYLVANHGAFAVHVGSSVIALSIATIVVGITTLVLEIEPADRRFARPILSFAVAVALLPGVARLYVALPDMVEWELEGHPELNDVYAFLAEEVPIGDEPVTVLFGGGWDQLPNNGLRWYLLTRHDGPRPAYADVRVVGDMIGSLIFPPEPRIAHWAEVLATSSGDDLPDRVVLVEHGEGFLYRARVGPEVAIYREILDRRAMGRELARRRFPALDCTVAILALDPESPPLDSAEPILAAHGITPQTPGNASTRFVGEGGWVTKDEALRHFLPR